MGNSYRHGLGHKCSRWRPRVHPVNTYLLMVTCRVNMTCPRCLNGLIVPPVQEMLRHEKVVVARTPFAIFF